MAYISFQPKDFFSTKLYTPDSSTWQAWTGVGFQPNFTWHKSRTSAGYNGLCDSVRGVDASPGCKAVYSNDTTAEETSTTEYLDGYQSDGFTTGLNGSFGGNGENYVAWCWKAGTTSGLSGGTITPSGYSINTTSGFGVYAYTGTGATATIAHGLGVAPRFMMFKELGGTAAWMVYHEGLGNGSALILNTNATKQNGSTYFNDTSPTSSVFTVGSNGQVNGSTQTYIAYVFAPKKGFSKLGSYTGNGSTDGAFINTGFRPAFVLTKKYSGADDWGIFDNKREGFNPENDVFYPNLAGTEVDNDSIDILSNGFKARVTSNWINQSGGTYIYMAFAEFPFLSSNNIPGVAR